MTNNEMDCRGFTLYDGCLVPPMPPDLLWLWEPRSPGNWEEPPMQAPIHDYDDVLELEMEEEAVEDEDEPDDAPAQDVVAAWEAKPHATCLYCGGNHNSSTCYL